MGKQMHDFGKVKFKKGFYAKVKKAIWERDNYTCRYCGLYMKDLYELWKSRRGLMKRRDAQLTVDHVIPRQNPHTYKITTEDNLVTCCWNCNQKKGGRNGPNIMKK